MLLRSSRVAPKRWASERQFRLLLGSCHRSDSAAWGCIGALRGTSRERWSSPRGASRSGPCQRPGERPPPIGRPTAPPCASSARVSRRPELHVRCGLTILCDGPQRPPRRAGCAERRHAGQVRPTGGQRPGGHRRCRGETPSAAIAAEASRAIELRTWCSPMAGRPALRRILNDLRRVVAFGRCLQAASRLPPCGPQPWLRR